jgi:hypothetical protein
LRHQRFQLPRITRLVATPFSIATTTLFGLGLIQLKNFDPKTSIQR